jgi:hypothetical protein|tara:strand:- start:2455 stop:2760 length:306 start_codon:yes stop_codon:yes gene_type:complete
MNEKIRLIRLTSGEEILVTIVNENTKRKFVKNPILLIPEPGAHGKIGFVPYLPYCEIDELMIKEEHIMFVAQPEEQLEDNYKSMVDGIIKIQTPPQQEIFA